MSNSLRSQGLYSPWNSPGQNTGVGSLSLLQWIFPTQGWNTGLPYCRQILYQLNHKGSPRILEWVAYPFSRGSSQPRNGGIPLLFTFQKQWLHKWNIKLSLKTQALVNFHYVAIYDHDKGSGHPSYFQGKFSLKILFLPNSMTLQSIASPQ